MSPARDITDETQFVHEGPGDVILRSKTRITGLTCAVEQKLAVRRRRGSPASIRVLEKGGSSLAGLKLRTYLTDDSGTSSAGLFDWGEIRLLTDFLGGHQLRLRWPKRAWFLPTLPLARGSGLGRRHCWEGSC